MGKTPQQRRKLKGGRAKKKGLGRQAQKNIVPKKREQAAVASIANDIVGKVWDKTKTLKQNFNAVGLVMDPNARARKPGAIQEPASGSSVVAEIEKAVKNVKRNKRFAAAGEIEFVERLVAKHGTDCVAMARDMKINVYQLTPKQLQQKIKRVKGSLALVGEEL
eukprot:m.1440234 g.1440234  ORF g.1440234 m.1440234 type:complete len:164 (+) comp25093_c2_seq4:158-649(+)